MTDKIISALLDVQEALKPACNGSSIDAVTGERLAKFVGRPTPWGRSQINAVRNGKQPAPAELAAAIMAYVYALDGAHPLQALSKPVHVLAVGQVHENAVILADDRACDYPLCNIRFVPRTPTQRHCCRDHQVKNYKLKRGTK